MRHPGAVLILLLGLPAAAAAQRDCLPGAGSNEARTLASFEVPLAFVPGGAPRLRPGFAIGLEGSSVPGVDRATATPTTCEPGKGPENTDLLPVLGRPRLTVPLPGGLALEASWLPPVRINQVRGSLFGVSLGKSLGREDGVLVALRAHATFGSVRAPVTCDDKALADALSECYGGTRSDDRLRPNIFGADLAMGFPMARGRIHPYAGAGFTLLRPRFQVHFVDSFGELENQRVVVNLERIAVFGGATWAVAPRLELSAELYAVPADRATGRVVVRTRLGHLKETPR